VFYGLSLIAIGLSVINSAPILQHVED